ncbi:MAG: transposase [Cyanobacteria bacterium P01_A01_bin.40]
MICGLSFGSVKGQTYVQMMQWLALRAAVQLRRKGMISVVLQDNASIHTCKLVKTHLATWQEQGLFLFQLPPYCSAMNLIEGEWGQIKAHHIRGQMFEDKVDLIMATYL